jgi:hypothetical protein
MYRRTLINPPHFYPEDGGNMHLGNADNTALIYTMSIIKIIL